MVAANLSVEFREHLTDRILGRLCQAAELVSDNLIGNRLQLRELLDDLVFELDAGDLALFTLASVDKTTNGQTRLAKPAKQVRRSVP